MEKEKNKYDSLINKLRDIKPLPADPEALTESILIEIQKTLPGKSGKILRIIRPVMATAAMFLTGLLISQQNEIPDIQKGSSIAFHEQWKPDFEFKDCADIKSDEKTAKETEILLKKYLCYIQNTRRVSDKYKRILNEELSKYQIKKSK